jgi:uncharacterized DUF497 family protein
MDVLFDAAKEKINIEKHGFSLSAYRALDMEKASTTQDKQIVWRSSQQRLCPFGWTFMCGNDNSARRCCSGD